MASGKTDSAAKKRKNKDKEQRKQKQPSPAANNSDVPDDEPEHQPPSFEDPETSDDDAVPRPPSKRARKTVPDVDESEVDEPTPISQQQQPSTSSNSARRQERTQQQPNESTGRNQQVRRAPAAVKTIDRKEYKIFMKGIHAALEKKCPGTAPSPFDGYWMEARYVVRLIGPFENIDHVMKMSIRLYKNDEVDLSDEGPLIDDEELSAFNKSDLRHWFDLFQKILAACKWLPQLVMRLKKYPGDVASISNFIDRARSAARTDDISRLKYEALVHLPLVEGIDPPGPKLSKTSRGWHCPATARMLCPRTMRDEFDADPAQFCAEVRNGQHTIDHDDWPTLVYSETEFDENNLDHGLLRSAFLLKCWLIVFKGPNSALEDGQGATRKGGRRTLAQVYDITRVDEASICYVVTLARFVLNSCPEWKTKDGSFHGAEFWKNTSMLFEDKAWRDETLAWWNEKALGIKIPGRRTSTTAIARTGPSSVSRLQQQRAARLQQRRPSTSAGES
ncbi:hypothetical protein EVJ58_g10673 [Rhodofomes roseus]|uniref:Uncharacterized protein n=1 Tax=Rhodofomes roseus TaxID=34475 RepID=A0A4Y9XN99_9APHY|nr:hypothetical protein EVJ58_g10673 [Rhodofomes roseus]